MEKFDFKKAFKHLFTASATKPVLIEVPECEYLMVDGEGHPDGNLQFQQAIQTLYSIMYTLKMGWKFEKIARPSGYVDFTVPPPETLWWMAGNVPFDTARPTDWRWTMLMMTPDFMTAGMTAQAAADVRENKGSDAIAPFRLERWEEGACVQMMHVGPYDSVGPTVEKMHRFAAENGYGLHGKHHEIYLSDPRRTAPEKLKTILRQPVRK